MTAQAWSTSKASGKVWDHEFGAQGVSREMIAVSSRTGDLLDNPAQRYCNFIGLLRDW
jgi:hypothetical protein